MILVDTSVLIDYLRGRNTATSAKFEDILDRRTPWGITEHIYVEILQGSSSDKEFKMLRQYLDTQTLYEPLDRLDFCAQAARLYFRCRQAGVIIRSTMDCLIAQTAIEHRLQLLHADKDFDRISSAIKELHIYA